MHLSGRGGNNAREPTRDPFHRQHRHLLEGDVMRKDVTRNVRDALGRSQTWRCTEDVSRLLKRKRGGECEAGKTCTISAIC